MYYKAIKCV